MRKVLFVAGEASGDLHAAGVASALRRVRPDLDLAAVGGPRLAEQGVELIHRDHQLGVMGFLEVLKHVPRHFLLLRTIRGMLDGGKVALVILIDYPGFNMKVAAAAKTAGVPVLYYVTPQVWAWGAGRIPKLARLVNEGSGHSTLRGAVAPRLRDRRDICRPPAAGSRGQHAEQGRGTGSTRAGAE